MSEEAVPDLFKEEVDDYCFTNIRGSKYQVQNNPHMSCD
jgi:hypothetical protein